MMFPRATAWGMLSLPTMTSRPAGTQLEGAVTAVEGRPGWVRLVLPEIAAHTWCANAQTPAFPRDEFARALTTAAMRITRMWEGLWM